MKTNPNTNALPYEERVLLELMQTANKVCTMCSSIHTMLLREVEETEMGISDKENKGTIFLNLLETIYARMEELFGLCRQQNYFGNKEIPELQLLTLKKRNEYRERMARILSGQIEKHPSWADADITDMIDVAEGFGKRAALANIIMNTLIANQYPKVRQAFIDSLPKTDDEGEDFE